jgi:hypothetical protein
MNTEQRKLVRTAMKQTSNAKSNLLEAVTLAGVNDPEIRQAFEESHKVWKRLWNSINGTAYRL